MSEGRRLGGLNDADTPPWLQPIPVEEDEAEGPSAMRLILGVILGIVLIGAAVGGFFWFMNRGDGGGEGVQLIKAEPGPYKVKAPDPGGMEIEGEGDTAFAASEGAKPVGRLNVDAVPEAPLTESGGGLASAAPGAVATVQLGAFSSEAAANKAWTALSGRFAYLEPLSHSIIAVTQGDKTLYRLRANGPDAASLCNRLRIAGETCVTVD
ncbi:SPOR domain-containing protein [Allosphingosinicella flava]|uniref:SPOR domain-containing protein n=1 Tax=Allosphingosinicella flava TaxID=2771430 RepID=A0A7T2GHL8_9SPHN|nr:SPOR domain-containing protein [Sphingosinicella flava]QPQ54046.1 SPOR domain-containing protein [Sphingosinicella flava]